MVHVDGVAWLVFRPYGLYSHSLAAQCEALGQLFDGTAPNDFDGYGRALEQFSIGRLAAAPCRHESAARMAPSAGLVHREQRTASTASTTGARAKAWASSARGATAATGRFGARPGGPGFGPVAARHRGPSRSRSTSARSASRTRTGTGLRACPCRPPIALESTSGRRRTRFPRPPLANRSSLVFKRRCRRPSRTNADGSVRRSRRRGSGQEQVRLHELTKARDLAKVENEMAKYLVDAK